jgi:alpha-N-arabinofuranosidase
MTEPGGPAWRQTTFFPFSITSRLAGDRAVTLPIESGTFHSARFGEVASVNAVATVGSESAGVFLVNRSVTDAAPVRIDLAPLAAVLGHDVRIVESHLLQDDDMYAANTLEHTERVGVRPFEGAEIIDGTLVLELPPVSWTAISLGA